MATSGVVARIAVAELAPEGEELAQGPVAREVAPGVSVEVALVADLNAEERRSELPGSIRDLSGGKRRCCGAGGRSSEIDSVQALPACSLYEAGKRSNIGRSDLTRRLTGAVRSPDVLVHRVAANAQHTRADALEESNEVAVGGGEDWGRELIFLVGKTGKGRADGSRSPGCDCQQRPA